MKPLIDGDILRYEIGFSCQQKVDGKIEVFHPNTVVDMFDEIVDHICKSVGATEAPTIYLTGDKYLFEKHLGKPYKPNFRELIATEKKYKGNRKSEKPYHFLNITEYMLSAYDVNIAEGLEADDMMGIKQTSSIKEGYDTVICSRDKDLRQINGYHFSWKCGKQEEIPLYYVKDPGLLSVDGNKVFGYGLKFFFYQVLCGDAVDNIPGLRGVGKKSAMSLLSSDNTEELAKIVMDKYEEVLGEDFFYYLTEQSKLVWMVREMKNDEPVFFDWKVLR